VRGPPGDDTRLRGARRRPGRHPRRAAPGGPGPGLQGEAGEWMKAQRCPWAKSDLYIEYHDTEWGVPVHDDRCLFEFLVLEGAQAGLSWETILKKRSSYREAFDEFDPALVARYGAKKVQALLANPGIVRNRLKIEAAIQNAKAFLAVQQDFGSF